MVQRARASLRVKQRMCVPLPAARETGHSRLAGEDSPRRMADPGQPLLPTPGSRPWSPSAPLAQAQQMPTTFNGSLSSTKIITEGFFVVLFVFRLFVLLKRTAIQINIYMMAF